jgi:hypothetical protein
MVEAAGASLIEFRSGRCPGCARPVRQSPPASAKGTRHQFAEKLMASDIEAVVRAVIDAAKGA